jgi:hypothetical protein
MIEPCPKCGFQPKSKSGKTLHEKSCDVKKHADIEEIQQIWNIHSMAVAMGDVHNPNNKPLVAVFGRRTTERKATNVYFRAILSEDKRHVYYCTKPTRIYKDEIETILDNWVDFAKEPEPSQYTEELGRCYVCGSRKIPGMYVNFSGVCVFCMLKSLGKWMEDIKL